MVKYGKPLAGARKDELTCGRTFRPIVNDILVVVRSVLVLVSGLPINDQNPRAEPGAQHRGGLLVSAPVSEIHRGHFYCFSIG